MKSVGKRLCSVKGAPCHEGDIVKSTRRACRGFGIRLLCSLVLGGGPRGRRTQADWYRGDQIVQDLGRDAFRSLLRRNSSPNLGRGGNWSFVATDYGRRPFLSPGLS